MRMIAVTRLDGSEFIINADLIETIEATPDTVITFARDKKLVVRETPEEIVQRVVEFRRRIMADPNALVTSMAQRPTAEQTQYPHKGQGTSRFRLLKQQDEAGPS